MYLKQRDKDILNFIEKHQSITIRICANLFFNNCKNGYYSASRRLKVLQDNGFLSRFRKNIYSEAVYYRSGTKPLNPHRIKLLEVYSRLNNLGTISTFEKEYRVPCGKKIRKNDGLIEIAIEYQGYKYEYPLIIEIDYTHDTSSSKIKELNDYGHFQNLYGVMPLILIVKKYEYQKKVFVDGVNIVYLDWNLEGIEDIFKYEE